MLVVRCTEFGGCPLFGSSKCDPLREKGEFRAKYVYELRSKIVEYAPLGALPALDTI